MPDIVALCNAALSHVGSDTVITSIDPPDGSVEAGHCKRFYPLARGELIEPFPWRFAMTRATLAQVANPSDVWAYAYALPSTLIRPWRVLRGDSVRYDPFEPTAPVGAADYVALPDERDSAAYTIEGSVLLTNEQNAVLLYTQDVTDAGRFSPTFATAFSYLMAAFLAGPLIKSTEGARTARELRKIARDLATNAATIGANSGTEPANYLPASVQARL